MGRFDPFARFSSPFSTGKVVRSAYMSYDDMIHAAVFWRHLPPETAVFIAAFLLESVNPCSLLRRSHSTNTTYAGIAAAIYTFAETNSGFTTTIITLLKALILKIHI